MSQQRTEPITAMVSTARRHNPRLGCPQRGLGERVVDAIGIGESIAFRNRIALAARCHKPECFERKQFPEGKFEQPARESAFAETVSVGKEHSLSRHSCHLRNDAGRISDVMQHSALNYGIKGMIGVWQGVSAPTLDERCQLTLVDKRLDRLDASDNSSPVVQELHRPPSPGANIQDGFDAVILAKRINHSQGREMLVALVHMHSSVGTGGSLVVFSLNLLGSVHGFLVYNKPQSCGILPPGAGTEIT
jgi:hypothetical protein